MNTNVFRYISYGVYIVSSLDGERPTGCTANSVMQVTSSPATVAVSINHDNFTNECIKKTNMFAVSILSETSNPSTIRSFGFRSGRDVNKFDGVSYEMKEGIPVINDSCGYLVCNVIDKMEAPTHTVFLGEVVDGDVFNADAEPMTYAYYHKVVKGKTAKNAPTYIADEKSTVAEDNPKEDSKTQKYVCQICGYVYEGDEVPADYKCPICGQGAEQFKKE